MEAAIKFNKSEIFRAAWRMVKGNNVSISKALRAAWNKAKCVAKKIVVETYKYAGKMASGFHDTLLEVSSENGVITIDFATVEYDSYTKPGKQAPCRMIAESGSAILFEGWKGHISIMGDTEKLLVEGKEVKGQTYKVKELIKSFGYKFDGATKSWKK
jgi:hypothetical protein